MPVVVDIVSALAVLGVLGTYAAQKRRSRKWGEMLFGCHVASALIGGGLLMNSRWLVALGFVFHVGVGVPSWLVQVIATRKTTALEVAAHVLPALAALPFVSRSGLPTGVGLAAWAMFLAMIALSFFFTDPELNVNLAHRPSPELARVVAHPMLARICVCAMSLLTLVGAELLLGHLLD